jgi:hypothetical protein
MDGLDNEVLASVPYTCDEMDVLSDKYQFMLDSRYFQDAMSAMSGTMVIIRMIATLQPVVMRAEGGQITYVIMPRSDNKAIIKAREAAMERAAQNATPPVYKAEMKHKSKRQKAKLAD